MNRIARWLPLAGLVTIAGCQDAAPSDPSSPDSTVAPVEETAAPTSVHVGAAHRADLVQHALLAFRQENQALAGGYRTYQAAIREGIVDVTPYTFADGERVAHAPMGLETTAITADEAMYAGALTATDLVDGAVVLQRGDVTERISNQPEGVEQEWLFAAAPPLEGDLVVEIAVSGYNFTETTANGLHFLAQDGGRLRYGNATWEGADGQEWPITAEYDSGFIRLMVPESVVAETVFPATLDPTITAEVAADAPVIGATGANQQHAAIAFGSNEYLVVWDDTRDSASSDIWATRLSTSGTILDALGLKIAAATGVQSNPTVAFNGTKFIVAWEDFKTAGSTSADIAAATVTTAGVVAALAPVAITATSETAPRLAARADGNALLTWNAAGALTGAIFGGSTFGASFAIASGTLVEPAGVAANPAGNYLVSYSKTTDLNGQLVSSTGTLSGAAFPISAATGTQSRSAAAFDGTNFDVVWTNNQAGIDIFGSRVSPTGTVLDTRTQGATTVGGVGVSTAANNQEFPAIACQSTGCLVLWQDRRNLATTSFDVFGQLMTTAFAKSGGQITITTSTGSQLAPAVVSNTAGYFTGWTDLRDNFANQVFGATVSSTGTVGTAAGVASGDNRESGPALGRAGGTFGLFYSDSRTFSNDLRYVRFNANGTKLDTTSKVASAATFAQETPAASADLGSNSLVVWADTRNGSNSDIYATRVNLTAGTAGDPAGIAVSTAAGDQLQPDVATNGTVALVVWQDRRGSTFDIHGALLSAAGALTVPDISISTAAFDQVTPAVTYDPASSQFIVIWADTRGGAVSHIFGTRVSTAGAVLDTTGVAISNGAVGQFTPALASTTSGTFAAWQDRRSGRHIFGTRLSGGSALTVRDVNGVQISSHASVQTAPKVGTITTSFVVLYVDDRNVQTDILGQQIGAAGTLSGTEFGVATSTNSESSISLLSGALSSTKLRVAYESAQLDTSRVESRVITSVFDQGSTCSGAAQCSSGFCVDGYCCDQACGGNHVPVSSTRAGDCHGCKLSLTNRPNGTCAPIGATTVCRNYENKICDLREYCNGTSTTCGPDLGRASGAVCQKSANVPAGVGAGHCPAAGAPGPHLCQ